MSGLAYSQIDDAVLLTMQNFVKRGAFVDMATDLQDLVAVREMWGKHKRKFEGGLNWEMEYQMDHNHSAKAVGLFQNDSLAITDTMVKGSIAVRHVNANYGYDVMEPEFQRGNHAIVDLIKTRYVAMQTSFKLKLEEFCWSKPEDSSDLLIPYGLAYWLTRSATEGFNGGNPTGFTAGRAGISTGTYPRYANYTGQYKQISKTDLIRKMRNAHRRTKFRSPVSHANPDVGKMGNGIYTNDDVIGLLEEIMEANNMNLGSQLTFGDRVMFKGTPIMWAPYLDDDSTDPVYMLDWKHLALGTIPGWENNLQKPQAVAGKHTTRRVDLDGSLNMICDDLRTQAIFYK